MFEPSYRSARPWTYREIKNSKGVYPTHRVRSNRWTLSKSMFHESVSVRRHVYRGDDE